GVLAPEDAGPINPGPAPNPCGPLQDPYGSDINGDCLGDLVIGAPGVLAPDGTTTTPNARLQVVVAKATTLPNPTPADVFEVVTNITGDSTHGRLGASLAIDPRRLPDGRRYLLAGEPNPLAYGRVVRFLLPLADEGLSFRGKKSGWFGDGFGSSVVAAGGEGNFLSAVVGTGLTNANANATAEGMIVTAARFEELSSAATLYTPDQLYPNATGQLQPRALFRIDDQDGDGRSDIAVSGVGLSVLGQAAGVLVLSSADLTVHAELAPPAGADASFGWAIASTPDFDNDGQTDLAISAPKEGNGKVYIRLSGGGFLTVLPAVEEPTVRGGFGFEVSLIGDLDDDGIVDLGVGEPFWDNNDLDTATGQPKFPSTVQECETLRGDGYTGNCSGRFSFVRGKDLADLAAGDDINAVVCARGEGGLRLGHSLAPIDEHFAGTTPDGATFAIGAPGHLGEGGIVFVLRPGRITQRNNPTRWVCADSAVPIKFAYVEEDAAGVISAIPGTYFGESLAR
ncbi:MAG: integrin alpha, partial [Myxococcota bacterium]